MATNTNERNTNLFYISYEYFATNSYWEESAESVIMNGYSKYGSNIFSSIICGGDSGGGDFYWADNIWYLIGVPLILLEVAEVLHQTTIMLWMLRQTLDLFS